jgi:hypothetical protein
VTATSTSPSQPVHRRRRARWIVAAALLLIVGIGLLAYSMLITNEQGAPLAQPSQSPTTTLSPVRQTPTMPAVTPIPSQGASGTAQPSAPPVSVVTSYVAIPTYVPVPADSGGDSSDVVSLVTAVSGLAASVLGLVSAFVSIRGTRARPPTGGTA